MNTYCMQWHLNFTTLDLEGSLNDIFFVIYFANGDKQISIGLVDRPTLWKKQKTTTSLKEMKKSNDNRLFHTFCLSLSGKNTFFGIWHRVALTCNPVLYCLSALRKRCHFLFLLNKSQCFYKKTTPPPYKGQFGGLIHSFLLSLSQELWN